MSEHQLYDSALKSLLGDEVAEILPNLLPGSTFISEQNIEIDRTTLKPDLVYTIQYGGEPHILNMELQTDADGEMALRLLKYHVGLHDKHRLPVISMVMYPFETSIPTSPFQEKSGKEILLSLHYRVLPLWRLEAQPFVRDHVVCMYTLLPAMKGANASMLLQAIEEMRQHYKEPQLGHHLLRFRTILRRSKTLPEQDKQEVEKKLQTFDSLLDTDPYIQEQKALERSLGITLGKELGRTEGRIQELQQMLLETVEERFPSLVQLAQQKAKQNMKPEVLRQLVKQVIAAPNEVTARKLLNTFAD